MANIFSLNGSGLTTPSLPGGLPGFTATFQRIYMEMPGAKTSVDTYVFTEVQPTFATASVVSSLPKNLLRLAGEILMQKKSTAKASPAIELLPDSDLMVQGVNDSYDRSKIQTKDNGVTDERKEIDELISKLHNHNNDADIRRAAADALLAKAADPGVEEILVAALRNDNNYWLVRCGVAEILGRIRSRHAVDTLIAALDDDETMAVRASAADALGEIGDRRATDPLIAVLLNKDKKDKAAALVRYAAAEALGKIGDPRAVEALTVAVSEEEWFVRLHAAEALGKIGDPRAKDVLTIALSDEYRGVREAAADALEALARI